MGESMTYIRIHDAGNQIGILKKGTVKAFLVDRDGREIILAIRLHHSRMIIADYLGGGSQHDF